MTCKELSKASGLSLEVVAGVYIDAVVYAERKALKAGKGLGYVDILLPDVAREMAYSRATLQINNKTEGTAWNGCLGF
jgi:hypothetical protein